MHESATIDTPILDPNERMGKAIENAPAGDGGVQFRSNRGYRERVCFCRIQRPSLLPEIEQHQVG
jgi:hypothetical protein